MKKIGYARVSTQEQSLELQIEQLEKYGCDRIYTDKSSGANKEREGLQEALDYMRPGDTLVIYKIDRLARSTFHLHQLANDLQEKGIGLVFIKEQIDFTTPSGKLMFTMLGAIAEFERDLINDRAREGRERAKAQGKHLGRKGKDEKDIKRAVKLFQEREQNGYTVSDIVKITGVPRATIYMKAKQR